MSVEISLTQRAVIVQADKTVAVQSVPVTMPGPGEVLVKNAVVAQNPSDWKTIEWGLVRPGDGVGSDFVGRIVALGQGVDDVKIGDRVSGWLLPESTAKASTAYREYSIIRSKPLIHIPDNVPDDEAATFFCATATAASGLRALLGFPLIAPYNRSLLVWGGSSVVGFYAIQLAEITGWKVIRTASPRNHDLVKAAGADVAVDYRAPDVIEQIMAAAGQGGVDYIFDAVSGDGSYQLASKALRKDGPRKVSLVLPLLNTEDLDSTVEYRLVMPIPMLDRDFRHGDTYFPRNDADVRFGVDFCNRVEEWMRDGRLKAIPVTVMPGGLNGVQAGFEYMKAGKVSGTKLVYRVVETL